MRCARVAGLLALANCTSTFPTAERMEQVRSDPKLSAQADSSLYQARPVYPRRTANDAQALFETVPLFHERDQYIDVSDYGPNPFKPPREGDLRGPCPGLNALANHGFLPRNGFATTAQFISATQKVFKIGPTLSEFLAVLGSTIDGDGTGWSIGGKPNQNIGGGKGISASHNRYETDASPTRADLYEYGNEYVRIEQWSQLSNMLPAGDKPNFDIATLTEFRDRRFHDQVLSNPLFFNGPFSGVLAQAKAYTFMFRLMANHSKEYSHGHLSRSNLQVWLSIRGTKGNYRWVPGHERIPYNWYRRPHTYGYDTSYFFEDVYNAAKTYPNISRIGGNNGTVNWFALADIAALTHNTYLYEDLGKGNNLACLALQIAGQAKADVINRAYARLQKIVGKIVSDLHCKKLTTVDETQLWKYPGWRRSQNGYPGEYAAASLQN